MDIFDVKIMVQRYRLISSAILCVFLVIAVFINWFFIQIKIDNFEKHGLVYQSDGQGVIWGTIIGGLFMVLWLGFYALEKTLTQIITKKQF